MTAVGLATWYLAAPDSLPFVRRGAPGGSTAGEVTYGSGAIRIGPESGVTPKIGEAAPGFTLLDLDGRPVSLADFRGRPVVLNFWATWCVPCRQEFPELVRLYERNKDRGLVVLGVNRQESADQARAFAAEFATTFPIALDSAGDVGAAYRLIGLPTTYIVDREGIIRGQHLGLLTPATLRKKLAEVGFNVSDS